MLDYLISRFSSNLLDTKGLNLGNLHERVKKEFVYVQDSKTLVVILPGWAQPLSFFEKAKKYITQAGASALIFEFPNEILSSDLELTLGCFNLLNTMLRERIRNLKDQYQFSKCVLVSNSLGGVTAALVYKDNPLINEVVLVCSGNNLAQNMWHGVRTQHLRKDFEKQNITLGQLKLDWRDLAPENHAPAPETKITTYFGKADRIIPFKEAVTLVSALRNKGFEVLHKNRHCGHYILVGQFILFPEQFVKL
ncbi:MAG: hypothetical protein AAB660_02095 [Patescibacteria group bacterium]|mgnify:CR=1 FL=1